MAEHPRREILAGGAGKIFTWMGHFNSGLVDWLMAQWGLMFKLQMTKRRDDGQDNLFAPMEGCNRVLGEFRNEAIPGSVNSRTMEYHPGLRYAIMAGIFVGAAALLTVL